MLTENETKSPTRVDSLREAHREEADAECSQGRAERSKLGYANEVGESFRAIVPISLVWASYGVATTYVMADAIDKGKKAAVWYIPLGALPHPLPAVLPCSSGTVSCSPCSLCCTHQAREHDVGKPTQVAVAVVDTFVWQALASVAIPGFTINRICAASLYFLGTMTHWPLPIRKWMTTAIGLSAIPVIIKPIDRSVDFLMDSSLRKLYGAEEKRRPSS
ncbi:mitochondrial fission process protein 1 isoform X2 [Gopherus evgoodei]|uniref:mitochondrial fission process protein 1 isoform X2 n=1 Tax=Gopherus evgoodei TaxID=1825980 RepID=UPI0011CFAA9C|nr:mitochondrial fission process protein 1 isoform X2 [Gopherus evgoodei]